MSLPQPKYLLRTQNMVTGCRKEMKSGVDLGIQGRFLFYMDSLPTGGMLGIYVETLKMERYLETS